MPAMSPASSSALVLLNPGLILSPMVVNDGAAIASLKAYSPDKSLLKLAAGRQLDVLAGRGDFRRSFSGLEARQHPAHAEARGIANLLESRLRQVGEQAYIDGACDIDIGAEGAGDDETIDVALVHATILQQH